ncbi:LOW QUALITY PROTEIN: hypothetical protein ACHAXA_009637 [Cyclostephanos tholiformis]|uniref:AAA+ ATPase domain-containing protein n=1 Tax=Cyclostephanos tholiformis TaxID=382380 RepID=A0ABD3SEP0_9STRA
MHATHATLREIGRPVPVPSPIISPGFRRREDDHVDADEGVGRLRNFFLYPPSSRGKRRFRRDRVDNDDDIEDIIRSTMMRPNDGDCYYDERRSHNRRRKYKPRQRLLALGTIFSVPTFDDRDYDLDDCVRADGVEVVVEEEDDASMMIRDVRFYQVVDASHCERSAEDDDAIIGERRPITTEGGRRMAYIISPSTRLVLLPPLTAIDDDFTLHPQLMGVLPMMRGYELRLPHPMLTISFLRSVAKELLADDDGMTDATRKTPEISKVVETTTTNYGIRRHHPSANDIVDALYLQGAIPADHYSSFAGQRIVSRDGTHPRIIHVIGKEENNVRACIDEACDIMGMRSFHVDGLGAFWAHYNLFNTYRQRPTTSNVPPSSSPLTGALPDKIRGLSASLDIARQSSPCVLHVAGIDLELSSTEGHSADPDARAEEERRVLEVIRAVSSDSPNVVIRNDTRNINVAPASVGDADRRGRIDCDMSLSHLTTPRVIVILSTSTRLPPGPLASSLLQRSIAISHPDANYARILWDNDIDGTFDSLSSYLIGMSAREIGYLRQRFAPRWQEGAMKGEIIDCPATAIKDHLCKPHTPVEVLQSLLPDLEITRSFTQSSRKGGGSNTLPLSSASLPNVRWEDIGGLESIRKEITDAVELPLKYPTLFEGSRRSGILLFGPPGTGKTLVAKAIARECGLPFLSVKGPELLGSYVGESEANIRAVFDAARLAAANPPTSPLKGMPVSGGGTGGYIGASVLFFDEFDSLAPRRGETGHGDGVMDRVVATLLGELDGSGGNSKGKGLPSAHVVVIAATNRPDLLDPSLLRPGRLDRLLYLGPAKTREHCLKILLAQTRKFSFDEGSDAATILERAMESFPPTLSGADLSAVASGALMRGIKRVCNKIEDEARSLNSERGVGEGSDMAVDIDDVMNSWSKDKLQPVMTAEDFVEAAKDIVPSISSEDLRRFETLQKQFSSTNEDVVATLLGELDGSGGNSKGKGLPSAHVVVIAATNRPDLLDPSLLRPGRLDRLLYLGPAKTREHCLKILLAQTRKFSFDEGSDAATILERAMESFPPTLSGADLSAVASGALMRGIKRVCNKIEDEARSLNSERGVGEGSDMAVDIDDVMNSWSKDKLQPVMTAEDFVEAAKDIVPSISSEDLRRFETLQKQFSSTNEDVVATLLGELDGSGGNSKGKGLPSAHVVVIAATNRPDLLDPSLLRPGRLDRLLYLGPAKTREHCLKILLAQMRKFSFDEGSDAATILERAMESFPPTLSGADLSAVASGALMRGIKRVCNKIEDEARSLNSERGVGEGSDMAVDIDDVMNSWSKDKLQPVMTAEDFVEAAKDIVPSISSEDLRRFETLQKQFSSTNEDVVATLLGELDGSGGNSKGKGLPSAHVVVIAATNRPDLLDPSLLRPGRLDMLLYLGPAETREHCLKILLAQTRKFSFDEGSDAATILERAMESFPPTHSGADLSAVASGALMRGIKRVCNKIEDEARSLNSERGVGEGSDMAVDIDDVMNSWSKDKLQPVMTAEDFVEAAKDIVPSISSEDLRRFETLQKQFSSWQYE